MTRLTVFAFAAGFATAGDSTKADRFDIAPSVAALISDDVEAARNSVRPGLALYIGGMGARGKNFYNDYTKRLGYEEAAKTIQDLFLSGKKAEAAAAVPDEYVDAIALVGPADRIRDRLGAWKEAGAKKHVSSMLIGGGGRKAFEVLAKELL